MIAATSSPLLPELHQGRTPLLISIPHSGTLLPPGLWDRFTDEARPLPDTDWFVARLYAFARDLGATVLIAKAARLVTDLNRPGDDQPLYSGSQTRLMTGVLPMQCFSGATVYRNGEEPDADESAERLALYWQPYHDLLRESLQHIRQQHGYAIVLDAHSIRAEVPLLFDGVLPDLNLGSNAGSSADPSLLGIAIKTLQASGKSLVVDGRFKGGYITRHYGRPEQQIHALQLEIAQRAYMNESPPRWDDARAQILQTHLRNLLRNLIDWAPENA